MNSADNHTPRLCTQDIGDAQLSYLSYERSGPPLIFLHATDFIPWLWHPLARELAAHFRIIVPSLCGHRDGDPEKGGLDWAMLAADTVRLCSALRLQKPYLVGHSMGGTVHVIAHALHGLSAAGMVLIEPIFLPPQFYLGRMNVSDHPLAVKALRRTNYWSNRAEAMAYLLSRSLFQSWDREMLDLYLNHGMTEAQGGGLQLACSPQREAALFMGGRQFDPWPLLPRIACPVLLIEGEKSDTASFVDFGRICSLIPGCTRRRVKEAGHLVPMEKPREVTRLIREFFLPSFRGRTTDN